MPNAAQALPTTLTGATAASKPAPVAWSASTPASVCHAKSNGASDATARTGHYADRSLGPSQSASYCPMISSHPLRVIGPTGRALGVRHTGVQDQVDVSATNEGGSKMMHSTHLVIGGGSDDFVMAARLSETPANNVVLPEAGRDCAPVHTPEDTRTPTRAAFW